MHDQEICQTCRFWEPLWKFKKEQRYESEASAVDRSNPRLTRGFRKDSNKGLCRRYAPQASALTSVWMETKNSDWCGDHQPIAEDPSA